MRQTILAQAIALIGVAHAAHAAPAIAQAEPMARVVITGSNIKRAATEGAAPVQTMTREQIAQSGALTVPDLLSRIPALGSGKQVDTRDGGFAKGVATASMRALGSASTLVLLNGRRIAPGAYADPNSGQSTQYDLNTLPLSAIERIEILKDGASAVYGSDAIAGVINFITRRNVTGGDIGASASADIHANFGRQSLNAAYGMGDLEADGYNAFVAFDASGRQRASLGDAVRVAGADYAAITGRLSHYYSGVSRHPVFYRETRPGNGNFSRVAGADLSCDPADIRTGSTALVPMQANDPLIDQRFCNYDGWRHEDAQGESDSRNLLSRAEFALAPQLAGFVEGTWNDTLVDYAGPARTINGRSPSTVFPLFGAGSAFRPVLGVHHPDNPTRTTATPVPVALAYRFEHVRGGSSNRNRAARVLAGLRGSHFDWDWDGALLHNVSRRHQVSFGMVHRATAERLYRENIPLAAIPTLPGITRDITLDGRSALSQVDLKGSREFGRMRGGAIGIAAGLEFKRESMRILPDPLSVAGDIVGVVNQFSQASRKIAASFVELRTPFTRALEMDWAARLDKYDGFRRSLTPKVGANYTFDTASGQAAVRATFARGFRAPALTQMVDGGTQYFINGFEDKLRCGQPGGDALDCARSLSGIAASNRELVPERARSVTLGLVASPSAGLDILLDLYHIEKKHEVDLLGAASVVQHPRYADRVLRDQNPGTWLRDARGRPIPDSGPLISISTPYVNAGGTRTSGVDLQAMLRTSLGAYGRLSTRLNSAYLISYKKAQNQGDPMFELAGTNGGIAYDLTSVGELPKWKSTLTSNWVMGAHSTTLSAHFVGGVSLLSRFSVQDDGTIGPYEEPYCQFGRAAVQPGYAARYPDCRVGSWTTVDLTYQFEWSRKLTLGLNVANLLDTRAPFDASSANYATAGYNGTLHNGRGRYFTVKAGYRF